MNGAQDGAQKRAQDTARTLAQVEAKLEEGDPAGAYQALRPVVAYPADALLDDGLFKRALRSLAAITKAFGGAELAPHLERVAGAPDSLQALYDSAYGLYEQGQYNPAAVLLARANRLSPGQPQIVTELVTNLEALHRNGEAALILDVSGTAERDPLCAYLSGFHWIMSGDLDMPRRRVAQLEDVEDGAVPFVRAALTAMLERADAALAAGILLDERALSAWQAVLSGTLLLHESPHGHATPMHGRYAFVSDSPGLMREGIERLALVLEASGERHSRVVAAPGRAARLLALAVAERLELPCVDWVPGAESEGLIVAWTMEATESVDFLRAAHHHAPGQRLFVHASCWTDPFSYAPDVTTLLYQSITHPYLGGALRFDPATQSPQPAAPDARADAELVREILGAPYPLPAEDASVTSVQHMLRLANAFRGLPQSSRPGFLRSEGQRVHQRAGGPVPSARFT